MKTFSICFCLILISASVACGQQQDTLLNTVTQRQPIQAIQLGGNTIELDGRLDEEIWQNVPAATGFIQREPDEGAAASEETEVYFLYDDTYLYIGARMFSENPSAIRAQVSRRDNTGNSQRLVIALDTFLDRRTAHSFVVTASGVRADYFQPEDEMNFRSRDYTFDPVWTAEAHIDSLGWTAEMRIPFSQLRFNNQQEQVWGLNINRFITRKNEDVFWELVPQDETGWASRFGTLRGIKNIVPKRRLELVPYVAGNSLITNPAANNPFVDEVNFEGRIGGDIEYGLGPNLTLNATVNPDFGQVEIDPANVNLSAFETIFEENRPFFTEGQQVFDLIGGGRETYFFSRRIGASPSLNPGADFSEDISNTSILGASKVTGRLPSGLSVGAISAVTATEQARVFDVRADEFDEVKVEPLTSYNALRLNQELGPNGSTAGFILTGVYRNVDENSDLSEILHQSAITGAGDWNIRSQDGKYEVTGDAGFSYVSGSKQAILETQRSSTHYFQRPDASHVSVDPDATSLTGFRGSLELSKNSGRHWLWEIGGSTKSPRFEANDLGILFQADEFSTEAELTYRENTPGNWYQGYRFELGTELGWNYGGIRKQNEIELEGAVELKNFWGASLSFQLRPRALSDRRTRGGPLMQQARRSQVQLGVSTDRSNKVFGRLFTSYTTDELGGYDLGFFGALRIRPGGNFEYSLEPRYSIQTNPQQYITTQQGGPAATFGNRYIFSTIDRSTLSIQFRVNYAFNPDLTLELFAEPFVSTGNFRNPGQLPKPRALRLNRFDVQGKTADGDFIVRDGNQEFEVEDPDFFIKSFRSNLVLRYQWRRGSTFFLVWQTDLSDERDLARFAEPGDLFDTFLLGGNNIIAIKFDYYLPI